MITSRYSKTYTGNFDDIFRKNKPSKDISEKVLAEDSPDNYKISVLSEAEQISAVKNRMRNPLYDKFQHFYETIQFERKGNQKNIFSIIDIACNSGKSYSRRADKIAKHVDEIKDSLNETERNYVGEIINEFSDHIKSRKKKVNRRLKRKYDSVLESLDYTNKKVYNPKITYLDNQNHSDLDVQERVCSDGVHCGHSGKNKLELTICDNPVSIDDELAGIKQKLEILNRKKNHYENILAKKQTEHVVETVIKAPNGSSEKQKSSFFKTYFPAISAKVTESVDSLRDYVDNKRIEKADRESMKNYQGHSMEPLDEKAKQENTKTNNQTKKGAWKNYLGWAVAGVLGAVSLYNCADNSRIVESKNKEIVALTERVETTRQKSFTKGFSEGRESYEKQLADIEETKSNYYELGDSLKVVENFFPSGSLTEGYVSSDGKTVYEKRKEPILLDGSLDSLSELMMYANLANRLPVGNDEVITNTLENVVWNNDKITNKSKFLEDLKNSAGNNYKQLDKLAEVAEAVSQISKNGERNIFFKTLPNGDKYFIGDSANVDAWTQGELGTNQDNSEEFSEESEEDNTSSDNARLKKVKTSRGDEVWR